MESGIEIKAIKYLDNAAPFCREWGSGARERKAHDWMGRGPCVRLEFKKGVRIWVGVRVGI